MKNNSAVHVYVSLFFLSLVADLEK